MQPKRATAWVVGLVLIVVSTAWGQATVPTTQEAMHALTDVWGEAALKQPRGPTYEFFEKLLPPLRYVDANFRVYPIALSAPSNPAKIRLVGNGSCINALARQPTYVGETGRPVTFFVGDDREIFGSDPRRLEGPNYVDGYLPIVQFKYSAAGATYSMEVFASVDPELAKYGTALVKLTLLKASGRDYHQMQALDKDPTSTAPVEGVEAAENLARSNQPYDEKIEAHIEGPELYGYKQNRVRAGKFKSYAEAQNPKNIEGSKIVAATYPRWVYNPGRGAFLGLMKTGQSIYLAVFTEPAEGSLKFEITPESYDAQRKQCVEVWNKLLDSGTIVKTPEEVVNNAWRSTLIGNYEMISGDEMRYSQGNQYAKRYIGEGGDAILAHALWGHLEDAKRMMPAQFVYTRKGLEFHQAAFKLQMLAHYYELSKDAQAVRAMRPMWQKEIDVIVKGRETENGMFPREKYCGDIDTRVFSLNSNANAWRALRDMSVVLDDIAREGEAPAEPSAQKDSARQEPRPPNLGDKEQAEKLSKIEKEYRQIILAALDKAIRRDVNPPFVPVALSGEENPHVPIWGTTIGSYWNLMIGYILGSGVFPYNSPTATDVCHYLQQEGGLMMGLPRARATAGNFWVYGGRLNDLYGMRYAITLMERDEADRALVSFYGKLAQGMTRNTFIGCEGSSIGQLDQFGRQMALPPNSAANANYLQQLRYMLVQDFDLDDDGRAETLRLCYATPRAWLEDGKAIEVQRAPTAFGEVSFVVKSDWRKGEVTADLQLPAKHGGKTLLKLRLPDGMKIQSASVGKVEGEVIDLGDAEGQVQVVAKVGK